MNLQQRTEDLGSQGRIVVFKRSLMAVIAFQSQAANTLEHDR